MGKLIWEAESARFDGFTTKDKIAWLAGLMFVLSIHARSSYTAGSDTLDNPKQLRAINELYHRITSHQVDLCLNEENAMSASDFFAMIEDYIQAAQLSEEGLIINMKKWKLLKEV